MNASSFTAKKLKGFIIMAVVVFSILINGHTLLAQYKSAPVKKDRLMAALRSRQFQTRDIVDIIKSNGVDFKLTAETRKALIAVGARPEVIKAVADNLRIGRSEDGLTAGNKKPNRSNKTSLQNYEDLLEQAMISYKDKKNSKDAIRYLQTAVKLDPKNPAAYQMLGFVNLYGLNDPFEAENLMRKSITKGGSAVFRVYHDDTGGFSGRCTGSLYISPETIRFESDDNIHTFETSLVNVDKFKTDTESNRTWKKYPVFKVFLKIGKETTKFRFAPVTGKANELGMVERIIAVSKSNATMAGLKQK